MPATTSRCFLGLATLHPLFVAAEDDGPHIHGMDDEQARKLPNCDDFHHAARLVLPHEEETKRRPLVDRESPGVAKDVEDPSATDAMTSCRLSESDKILV